MTDEERRGLEEALDVIDKFRAMMDEDIRKRTGCMYMTEEFLGLETAAALVGAALGKRHLAVEKYETRRSLMNIAVPLHAAAANAVPESELEAAALSLESCLYAILNETWEDGVYGPGNCETSLNRVIQAADYASDILDGILAAGEATSLSMQADPDGPSLYALAGDLKPLFRSLIPKPPKEESIHEES